MPQKQETVRTNAPGLGEVNEFETQLTNDKETPKPKEVVREVVVKESKDRVTPTHELDLPTLVGMVTKRMLAALQSTDPTVKTGEVASARRELRIWYEGQPTENRKDIAKNTRKLGEQFKQIAEQINQDIVALSFQDLG